MHSEYAFFSPLTPARLERLPAYLLLSLLLVLLLP